VKDTADAPGGSNSQKNEAQKKASDQGGHFNHALGWLMGLEPTTTGITILDSTN
jgi:hypothetical protein